MASSRGTENWQVVGYVGVDSGLIWIGDPCYILHKDKDAEQEDQRPPSTIGKDWGEFCSLTHFPPDQPQVKSFNYSSLGHEGLGVCAEAGYGDGNYPVEARFNEEGRIAELRIIFIREDDSL